MQVPAGIFREYDVRGLVTEQLTETVAFHLGRAVGTTIRKAGGELAVVGRDHRISGLALANALAEGMVQSGLEVVDIGVTPTPVQYWAIQHLKAAGGVQVTGSHNPPEYNGFKITGPKGSLYGEQVQELRTMIESEDYVSGNAKKRDQPVLKAYLDDLAGNLKKPARPLKVVVDAGNGTGGITAVPLYERLGYDVVQLFCEPDGQFPNHHPDPTVEKNLTDLQKAVAEEQADLGIAFDGDADRIGVVDRDGTIVWGDRLMILLARAVLSEQPGATIIGEVKCSKTLYDDIIQHGGKRIMWRAGHSLIKAKMKEEQAALAGEMSGHIFYQHRYYGFDDAVYAGGRLLEILSHTDQSIGELLSDVPVLVSTPEIRMECPENIKFELVQRVIRSFRAKAEAEGYRVVDIDGARVEWPDGWGLVRPSNTQPILVLRFEAQTEARMHAIQERFEAEIDWQRQKLEA